VKGKKEKGVAEAQRVFLKSHPTVGEDYQISGIPHTYLVGPDGLVLYSSSGWTEEKKEELIRVLDELLPVG